MGYMKAQDYKFLLKLIKMDFFAIVNSGAAGAGKNGIFGRFNNSFLLLNLC